MNKQQMNTFTPYGLLSLKIASALASVHEFKKDYFGNLRQEHEIMTKAYGLASMIMRRIPESKVLLILDFAAATVINKSIKSQTEAVSIIVNFLEELER